ncbi:hypothetical protein GJ744_004795 [Endocarpon pusillum]|uniref:Uncharacterized protein n=1 Tax=Endocarpon pusillum TaxID=364733 RepID=A0A8H7A7R7_9EURO|nr:hypothetical protein GJ744_004795 [Endocarpon pusillum]
MASKQFTPPFQTQTKPPFQRSKNMAQSSTSVSTRQPPMSAKAAGKPSSTFCAGRITNPGPSTKGVSQTNLPTAKNLVVERGQQLNSTGSDAPLSPGKEPYDKQIKDILKLHPRPDGADGYLHNLRLSIYYSAALAQDPETRLFTDQGDLWIKQMARVLDELKTTGQCRIGDEIIRP